MDTESFAATPVGKSVIGLLGAAMDSRFRYRFFGPDRTLRGAGVSPGEAVLEIGCGTGFYTIPAARLLGDAGSLIALDVVPESVEVVSQRVGAAGLDNVRVLRADARDTGLEAGIVDRVLLFGVIPAPMLPLADLLPELRRVLCPGGVLAVWPPVPIYLPESVVRGGLFAYVGRRDGVCNFERR